jgi:hypothetical protein
LKADERDQRQPRQLTQLPDHAKSGGGAGGHQRHYRLQIAVVVGQHVPKEDRQHRPDVDAPHAPRTLQERQAGQREREQRTEDRHVAMKDVPIVGHERERERRAHGVRDALQVERSAVANAIEIGSARGKLRPPGVRWK